jgi:hypothetical protein
LAAVTAAIVAATAAAGAGSADVAVALAAPPEQVPVGRQITLAVTLGNNGPESAGGVTVSVALTGAKATIASASASTGATCTVSATARRMRCVAGLMVAGASVPIAVKVDPVGSGNLDVTVSTGSRASDPDSSNGSVQARMRLVEAEAPAGVAFTGATFDHAFQLRPSFSVSWLGSDTGSGVASYDVRVRDAARDGPFAPPAAWQSATPVKRAIFPGRPGHTYCFSVRATDRDRNSSPWSAERCTATLLPPQAATRHGEWMVGSKRGQAPASVRAHAPGASLVLAGVVARRLALVLTVCPGCGTLRVSWNGVGLRTIRLNAPQRNRRELELVEFPSARRGTLTIAQISPGNVSIDGLGISRA